MSQHIPSYRNSKQNSPPATMLAYHRISPTDAEFTVLYRGHPQRWLWSSRLRAEVDQDGPYWTSVPTWERLQ